MKDTILEKDTFFVTVKDDHSFDCSVVTLGRTGENAVTQLEITIPDELCGFWAYLDFKKPSGKKLKTPRLNIVNNKIEYDIPGGLLDEGGGIEAQLVLEDENGRVWKSTIKKYVAIKSIDAVDDIPEPENFISAAQKILDETVKTTEDVKKTTSDFITEANTILLRVPEKREVDPVFANNSWDLIKWVCQHDDPSKYWKVGDYKMVHFPSILSIDDPRILIVDEEKLKSCLRGANGQYQLHVYQDELPVGDAKVMYYMQLEIRAVSTGRAIHEEFHSEDHGHYNSGVYDCGIKLTGNFSGIIETTISYQQESDSPLQIIGFNHDKVADPYTYGKQKAGMTLQLGVSRNMYGDTKASLFDGRISGIMTTDGKYFKSPNSVDMEFRVVLQTMFDGTEIAPYLTKVQKYTSQYYNPTYHYYAPIISNDKVFLPSEYEVFGFVIKAPGQEGEQYELYKDGYSRFMWSNELLNGAIDGARIWLRSASGSHVSKDNPNSAYCTSVYIHVHNRNPLSVSHAPSQPSAGTDGVPAYIAPCICL